MGLFDFINKAQETVDNMQKKAEEWQAKANQFANGIGTPTGASSTTPPPDNREVVSEGYTCPICGNHQESGKKAPPMVKSVLIVCKGLKTEVFHIGRQKSLQESSFLPCVTTP